MKLEVIASKDAQGNATLAVKPSTNKPEWGSVLVMETAHSVVNGLIVQSKRIAAYRAKLTTFEAMNITLGCDFNEKLKALGIKPMRIFVKESLTPQFEGHEPKKNPSTNQTVTTDAGQPIYYNTVVDYAEAGKDEFVSKSAVAVNTNSLESQIA